MSLPIRATLEEPAMVPVRGVHCAMPCTCDPEEAEGIWMATLATKVAELDAQSRTTMMLVLELLVHNKGGACRHGRRRHRHDGRRRHGARMERRGEELKRPKRAEEPQDTKQGDYSRSRGYVNLNQMSTDTILTTV